MVQLHKQYPALGEGSLTWIDNGNNAVLAFYRIAHNDRILAIHNLSRQLQHVELVLPNPPATLTDLFKSKLFSTNRARLDLDLTPHQYLWLI
ncbi:MAG TPA: alpha-glucosidase C-terminal domain-containing protein [Anaerolineales bacterium]|nr:alpha-glucosidase C-terminal domain-containing protein [Anaerolineales bacterium]